jgi:hypothetical protein
MSIQTMDQKRGEVLADAYGTVRSLDFLVDGFCAVFLDFGRCVFIAVAEQELPQKSRPLL